ncbi:MAG: DUF4330 domain-containing protein [Clostridia bacterium]|nr:DUF4330 domain-containing protein [Clostridia bacterium]
MEKKRITIIDILIVLLVIIIAAFALFKLRSAAPAGGKTVTYTVLIANQLPEVAENIVPEENVLLDTTTNSYGDVTAVDVQPASDAFLDAESGRYVLRTTEERKDVYITVSVTASENEWGYDIGEQHIRVGEKQIVSGRGFAATGYIVGVQY